MDVVYQSLDFDLGRAQRFVEHVAARAPELRARVRGVLVGDASCSFRNQHTLAARWTSPEVRAFLDWRREQGLGLRWQLPLVVKENELKVVTDVAELVWDDVDGFACGDVGMLEVLKELGATRGARELVYVGNVHNRTSAQLLTARVPLVALRPLFPKRELLVHDVGIPRELTAFGNMLINCSTFCFHCGDLPTRCDYSCVPPKHLVMEGERVAMVGRSLFTADNRIDLIELLPTLPGVTTAVLADLDLDLDEALDAVRRICAA